MHVYFSVDLLVLKNALKKAPMGSPERIFNMYNSQGCYLDECQWLALVQVDSDTYCTSDTESLECSKVCQIVYTCTSAIGTQPSDHPHCIKILLILISLLHPIIGLY